MAPPAASPPSTKSEFKILLREYRNNPNPHLFPSEFTLLLREYRNNPNPYLFPSARLAAAFWAEDDAALSSPAGANSYYSSDGELVVDIDGEETDPGMGYLSASSYHSTSSGFSFACSEDQKDGFDEDGFNEDEEDEDDEDDDEDEGDENDDEDEGEDGAGGNNNNDDQYLEPLGPHWVYRSRWWETSYGSLHLNQNYVKYRFSERLEWIAEDLVAEKDDA